ncbi:MAG: serine/threonine protein kinase [Anaerobutyricum hallii]
MIQTEPHHLRMGTRLNNRYLIQGVLGEGGFGITYVGMDEVLCQKVAVKEFFPRGAITRNNQQTNEVVSVYGTKAANFHQGEEKFLQEARTLAQFNNVAGVVRVQDFFRENGTAYIVMEYLEGITLKQYLQTYGPISVEEMQNIFAPILEALDKIHQNGVIHRDISPDNIMCLPEGEAKLMDFGAARDYTDYSEEGLSVILKMGFAPIEQYDSHGKQGPWTDIYALGATMYQCLTGRKPDDATKRSLEDTLVSPSMLGVRIAPPVEYAIMGALQIRPADRYRNLGEFCENLYSVVSDNTVSVNMNTFTQPAGSYDWGSPSGTSSQSRQQGYPDVPPYTPPQPPVKTKNSTPLIVALCCTLTAVIMIGIGVVLFTNSKNSQTAGNTARAESGKESEKVAENTTAATQSTTESKSQDTQQSKTEQQAAATQAASTTEDTVDTQAVGADGNEEIFEDTDASADYSECLSLDNYTYLESPDGDYTFYYPQNVYNYAYYDGDSCIFTSDDENDTVKFIRKDNTSGSPAQGMENLYNSYTNLSQKEKILFREETDERGFARGVLSGITDNQNVYASIAANDDYVYIMEVCTSFQHDSTKSTWVEYYIDCMYRYCSFSRRVGDPRSYEEYMEDQ